jgi:thiamine pyrophosphate-dependent acetolactate synthase large subunit-like protein
LNKDPDQGNRVSERKYGSDFIVDVIRRYGIPYAAFNPGASFRGIHDSLVNYLGNHEPELLECTHEEISVAIAHGYARASGKPMVAIVHNVVGLQHATMAIYNAWCDRVPVIVLGGTGPMSTPQRRPGSDWVHTALVQGNLVRDFVKWDDQPHDLASVPERSRNSRSTPSRTCPIHSDCCHRRHRLRRRPPSSALRGRCSTPSIPSSCPTGSGARPSPTTPWSGWPTC